MESFFVLKKNVPKAPNFRKNTFGAPTNLNYYKKCFSLMRTSVHRDPRKDVIPLKRLDLKV